MPARLSLALSFAVLATTATLSADEPAAKDGSASVPAIVSLPSTGLSLAAAGVAPASYTDTYYLSDYLATTIGSVDTQGVIDQMEIDAFGAPLAAGRPALRYTGKPYDADMGAYIFPFRNYRPDEAHWMTPDPVGFPDGMNNMAYAPIPTLSFDTLGLWDITDNVQFDSSNPTTFWLPQGQGLGSMEVNIAGLAEFIYTYSNPLDRATGHTSLTYTASIEIAGEGYGTTHNGDTYSFDQNTINSFTVSRNILTATATLYAGSYVADIKWNDGNHNSDNPSFAFQVKAE